MPRIAAGGAGAAWLRDPRAMVEMARRVVAAVSLPVTVKTRIGWGPESDMPIVDLARRLEDAGVAGLTIHCRTAQMGHEGPADWRWAARAREAVAIPVVVNGDVRSADDAARALAETGCAGVMVGRAAIDYPWIFREAQALVDGARREPASEHERVEAYRWLVAANARARGERFGVEVTRRHLGLLGPRLRPLLQRALYAAKTVAAVGWCWTTRSPGPSLPARHLVQRDDARVGGRRPATRTALRARPDAGPRGATPKPRGRRSVEAGTFPVAAVPVETAGRPSADDTVRVRGLGQFEAELVLEHATRSATAVKAHVQVGREPREHEKGRQPGERTGQPVGRCAREQDRGSQKQERRPPESDDDAGARHQQPVSVHSTLQGEAGGNAARSGSAANISRSSRRVEPRLSPG